MRILYITNEMNKRNGWGIISYYTAKSAALLGNYVEVLFSKNSLHEHIDGVICHAVLTSMRDGYLKFFRVLQDVQKLKKIVARGNFDVIHILVEPFFPLANFLAPEKVICSIVGTYAIFPFQRGVNKWLYKRSLKKINRIVSISDYTAQRFNENNLYNIPVHTIPLGVDSDLFAPPGDGTAMRKENSFCFVGHIKPRKGLLYAIQAVERLKHEFRDVKLYVLGEEDFDEYAAACKRYVTEHHLQDMVIFAGFVPNDRIKEYYFKCAANVLPSVNDNDYFEGFGLIHLEANAAGIPSIGSKNCGNESAISDGVTGFLCEQKNVDLLHQKMRYILSIKDTAAYHALCKRCREHAIQNDWKSYIEKVVAIYNT